VEAYGGPQTEEEYDHGPLLVGSANTKLFLDLTERGAHRIRDCRVPQFPAFISHGQGAHIACKNLLEHKPQGAALDEHGYVNSLGIALRVRAAFANEKQQHVICDAGVNTLTDAAAC